MTEKITDDNSVSETEATGVTDAMLEEMGIVIGEMGLVFDEYGGTIDRTITGTLDLTRLKAGVRFMKSAFEHWDSIEDWAGVLEYEDLKTFLGVVSEAESEETKS